ncbi:MAG: hypothetical protein JWQ81_6360 [Amycolatopsis sp.]|uniref:hypothetical protein n=1 Tax=Amycolatopsis sp. TaxID=37632 RepID=UPI0026218DEA|nr:hypothetical protein [Amycolatopsis sp.]MCU1685621.1 hypothetical protein [Amycolatopsis sp.]
MRMVFTGADPEVYSDGARRILAKFDTWAQVRERAVDVYLADAMLTQRYESDGLLGRWNEKTLRDMLLLWMPRHLTLDEQEQATVLPTVEAFFDFLDDSDLLDERSEPVAVLRETTQRLATEFATAMADPANFGISKFWAAEMVNAGVDPTDPVAMAEFSDLVQAGEIEVDQQLLTAIAQRQELGDPDLPAQHASMVFDLLGEDELRELAGETKIVARLRGLFEWVGEGRAVTSKGSFKLEDCRELVNLLDTGDEFDAEIDGQVFRPKTSFDLPELHGLFEAAKAIHLVQVTKGRVLRVPAATTVLEDPLRLWEAAFAELDVIDEARYRLYEPSPYLSGPILSGLAASPLPLPAPILLTMLEETVEDGIDDTHLESDARLLADFGALKVAEATGEELDDLQEFLAEMDFGDEPMTRQIYELLPLGHLAVWTIFAANGIPTTTIEDLADETAEVLVTRLDEATTETFEKAADGWLAKREPARARAELSALAARTDDPGQRLSTFQVLGKLGDEGVEVIRSLRDHPSAGPSAGTWLVGAGLLDASELSRSEVVYGMLDVLLTMPDELVDEFATQPRDVQLDLLGDIPKTGHPRAAEALEMIATEHGDKVVAKAARKALYRLGSRG